MTEPAEPAEKKPDKICPKCQKAYPAHWPVPFPSMSEAQADLIKRGVICTDCCRDANGRLRPTDSDIRQSEKWKQR